MKGKIFKHYDGNLNDILKEEEKNIIYNYNNTKISKTILYNFIDILNYKKHSFLFI